MACNAFPFRKAFGLHFAARCKGEFAVKHRVLVVLFVLFTFSVSIAAAQDAPFVDACVTEYDPAVDYFPEKVEPAYAVGWEVEYFNNYKVVTVTQPFTGATADDALQYLLVQCGTPAPEGYEDALTVEVPVETVMTGSTSYIPHLADIGEIDSVIGMDSVAFVSNPDVIERAAAGEIVEIGSGPSVNVEVVINAEPDMVIVYGSGSPDSDTRPTLIDAGVFTVVATDFNESTPLGQAEWGKFIALFFNREAEANAAFDEKVARYNELAALTAAIPEDARPTVLWNSYVSFSDAWFIPGSESFAAQFVRDAGGELVLGDAPEVQGTSAAAPFAFEVVYEAGLDADYWMPGTFAVPTLDDLLAQDERYADFAAVENGNVYNFDARENANGGNDYFEAGVANPQIILADLIKILHPELLPEHELYFFRQLPAAE